MVKTQVTKKETRVKRPQVKGKPINKKLRSANLVLKNKLLKKKKQFWRKSRGKKGVVYLSHIPHGFYEDQIDAYFRQFGKVTAVSVPKSKSGKAKGYAFIEFQHPEVAEIAADTMNNYLMFNRVLKAKCIPLEEQKPRHLLAARAAKLTHTTVPEKAELNVTHNRKVKNRHLKTSLEAKLAAKLLRKSKALTKTLNSMGIDYEFQVENANVESVFKRNKELIQKKYIDSQNSNAEKQDLSIEDENDLSSLEDIDMLSEDENKAKEIILKTTKPRVKNVKLSIKKKKEKPTTLLSKSNLKQISNSVIVKSKNYNEELPFKKLSYQKEVSKSKDTTKTPLKTLTKNKLQNKEISLAEKLEMVQQRIKQIKSSKKGVPLAKINENQEPDNTRITPSSVKPKIPQQNKTPYNTKVKHLTENSPTIHSPKLNKKGPPSLKTPKSNNKKQNLSVKGKFVSTTPPTPKFQKTDKFVMEVDNNDDEINFKTPPNVIKKFINTKEQSTGKVTKGNKKLSLQTSKEPTSKVKSASPKKPRHRLLKRMSVA